MDYKIKVTQNYNAFTLNENNRKVVEKHVQRLVKEFKENGYNKSFPIAVIDKGKGIYEIFDGQHRFLAAKQVGCEFSYLVHEKFEADEYIKKLASINKNVQKWSALDFARLSQDENTKKAVEYTDKAIDIRERNFIMYYCCINRKNVDTKKSETSISEEEITRAISLFHILQKYRYSRESSVSTCVKKIVRNNLDTERLIKNIEKQPVKFVQCATAKQYQDMIEYFYNYNYPKANRIHFDDLE